MIDDGTGLLEAPSCYRRIMGRIRGTSTGPTLIVMTGIHGNEPAGVNAAKRVLEELGRGEGRVRGELIILTGNLRALAERTRFIDRDLNRQWTPKKVADLLRAGREPAADGTLDAEGQQQREVIDALSAILAEVAGPIYFLDLHTSSAHGPPFLTVGDTLRNRRFAMQLPLPVILGLEEQVDGSMLEYLNNCGFVTMGVEAGHHDAADSVDRHEAVLWLSLAAARLLEARDVPRGPSHRALLERASRGIPRVVEVRHRHAIEPADGFTMEPGYENFRPVEQGKVLAHDRQGAVVCPEDGRILLPLYQPKGEDGFFVAREVHVFWLRVSAVLRYLRLDHLMGWLPGVRRDPRHRDVLIVDTRVARIYPLEIFHLFGFRKLRRTGSTLLVSRRRHDLRPPQKVGFPELETA